MEEWHGSATQHRWTPTKDPKVNNPLLGPIEKHSGSGRIVFKPRPTKSEYERGYCRTLTVRESLIIFKQILSFSVSG